jgi:hypothetical protein
MPTKLQSYFFTKANLVHKTRVPVKVLFNT